LNLNVTIVQLTGLGVAGRAAILGLEEVASVAFEIAAKAAEANLALSLSHHAAKRDLKGVGLDLMFFVVPEVANKKFIDGIEVLSQQERYILKSLNDFQFKIIEQSTESIRYGKSE